MSDTKLRTVPFKPGMNKTTTDYGAEGYWVDGDKVRWRDGNVEKIGGWVRATVQQEKDATNVLLAGTARDIFTWVDLNSNKYLVVGSNEKIELVHGGIIYNITPYRDTDTLTDAITTVSGESVVTITDTNHGTVVGDRIQIDSQATAVDGITLSGEYVVESVVDFSNFTVDSGTTASGSTSGGGGALAINYYLENGYASNGNLTGYGGGTWGTEGQSGQGYNRPRAGVGGVDLRQVSFDNWGEDLLTCIRNGKIYHWDASVGTVQNLQQVANAPEENSFICVSQPSRHLIAFGSETYDTGVFDPLIIRWPSQETLTEWDITATNSAGEYRLPKGNYIVGAVQTRSEILVFTDTDVYSMSYIGGNDVFQFDPLGTNSGTVSQHSAVDVNGVVYWMGRDAFYVYDGIISVSPCAVNRFIFDEDGEGRLNFDQKEKTYCGTIKEFNEIIYIYPNHISGDNSRYVIYNYVDGTWYTGTTSRTVWEDKGVFDKPHAVSDGVLYIHETGKDDDGSPLEAWVESGMFDIEDGTELAFLDRIVPDLIIPSSQSVEFSVTAKKYPHPSTEKTVKGPYTFSDANKKISCRVRGRQMSLKISSNSTGGDFSLGKLRVGLQTDGGQ